MKKLLHSALLISAICFLQFKSNAAIQVVSVANYQFTPSNFSVFIGDTVMFVWSNGNHTTTSTSVPSGALGWNSPMNSSTDTFIYIPAATGTYNFHCAIHASMTGQFTVTTCVPPDYSSAIGIILTACEGTTAMFDASSSVATSYQWYLNNNPISGATNATYVASTAGTYQAIAMNSCGSDTTPINGLTFVPNPTVTVAASIDTVCGGQSVTLVGSGGLLYTWQSTATLSSGAGDTVTASAAASFEVILTGTDFNGCSDNDTVSVTVLPTPVAAFTFTHTGTTVNTNNTSTGANVYDWNFGDGTTDITTSPSHTYASTGIFTVQLIATNTNGCSDTTTQIIDLADGIFSVAGDQINFSFNNETKELVVTGLQFKEQTVTLYDLSGRILVADSFVNSKIISLQTVTPGIYFAEVAVNNQRKTLKLFVN